MSAEKAKRDDLIVGAVALVLLLILLELPWYTVAGGTVSGISLPSISDPATGSPAPILGVLAVLATLAILFDLVFLYLSPRTHIPAIGENRSFTRFVLAVFAAVLLAIKFALHLSEIGNLGVGFWLAVPLTAALVWGTMQARREEPSRSREEESEDHDEASSRAESADDNGEGQGGGEDSREADSISDDTEQPRSAQSDGGADAQQTSEGAEAPEETSQGAEPQETSGRPGS